MQHTGHVAARAGERDGRAVDGDRVNTTDLRQRTKGDAVALFGVGTRLHRGAGADGNGAAAGPLDRIVTQGATFQGHLKGQQIGRNHTCLKLCARALVHARLEPDRRCRGCADQGHVVPIQIGRGLVVGITGHGATGIAYRGCPLGQIAGGFHDDAAMQLGGTRRSRGFDQVNAHIAIHPQINVFTGQVRKIAQLAHIGGTSGTDRDGTALRGDRFDHQPVRLVDTNVAGAAGGGRDTGHHGVEQNSAAGAHVQMVTNKDRSTVDFNRRCHHLDVATGGGVGTDNAAQDFEVTAHVDLDVGSGVEAAQTADKATEREVAGARRLLQFDVNVAKGTQLEVIGGQRRGLHRDKARVLGALVFVNGIKNVAITVQVGTTQCFFVAVKRITITIEVQAETDLAQGIKRVAVTIEVPRHAQIGLAGQGRADASDI